MSQLYPGGSTTTSTFNTKYVELHNRNGAAQDLSNWSLQYETATGTTFYVAAIPAGTTIAANGYLLVGLDYLDGGVPTGGTALPITPDLMVAGIYPSSVNGKLALANSTTPLSSTCAGANLVDLVGYGTANCSAGNMAAPASSPTTALLRAGDCTNTNVNSADFTSGTPAPRSSTSAAVVCPCP